MTTLFAELMAGAIGDIDRFERVEATIAKTPLRPCRASAKLRRRVSSAASKEPQVVGIGKKA